MILNMAESFRVPSPRPARWARHRLAQTLHTVAHVFSVARTWRPALLCALLTVVATVAFQAGSFRHDVSEGSALDSISLPVGWIQESASPVPVLLGAREPAEPRGAPPTASGPGPTRAADPLPRSQGPSVSPSGRQPGMAGAEQVEGKVLMESREVGTSTVTVVAVMPSEDGGQRRLLLRPPTRAVSFSAWLWTVPGTTCKWTFAGQADVGSSGLGKPVELEAKPDDKPSVDVDLNGWALLSIAVTSDGLPQSCAMVKPQFSVVESVGVGTTADPSAAPAPSATPSRPAAVIVPAPSPSPTGAGGAPQRQPGGDASGHPALGWRTR